MGDARGSSALPQEERLAEAGKSTAASSSSASSAAAAAAEAVRAAVMLRVEHAAGRAELAELSAALRDGSTALEDALARLRPDKRLVSVILSADRPMRVDSRDTLVRHYCGERVANAMFRVMRNRWYQISVTAWTALLAFVLPACFTGSVSPWIGLGVWVVHASLLLSCCALLFVRSLLRQIMSRFDFIFLAAHLGLVSTAGAALFVDPVAGCLWFLSASYILVMLCWDAMPRKSRMSAANYVLHCVVVSAMFAGMFFKEFATRVVEFALFDDIISVNARVYSSVFTYAVFGIKFAISALIFADNLIVLRGLRCVKVPSAGKCGPPA